MLDYKTTGKIFFDGRKKLHANLHRPLTPVKKIKVDDNEKGDTVSDCEEETSKNKIKEKVTNLNKVVETPKIPSRKAGTQISFASASKPNLERHKGF